VTRPLATALTVGAIACGGAAHPAAPPCPHGDVVVSSQASIDGLAACTVLDGDLHIRTGAALDLAGLGALTRVTGSVIVGPTLGLDAIAGLSHLREVGGALRLVANADATGAFFPALERAGRVELDGNLALGQVMLPALREVTADLVARDNAALELIDLGGLAHVAGSLTLERNPVLATVLIASPRCGAVVVQGNPTLDADMQSRLIATAVR
jgi:hypothetical protein